MNNTNEIQVIKKGEVEQWSKQHIQLIKDTIAKGATDTELQLFLYVAKKTGLDPLTRQIHFVKRKVWDKTLNSYREQMTIQTGIDGFRTVAERSHSLAGIDDAVYDSEDEAQPKKATVTVYRLVQNQRVGFTATARWTEYAQTTKEGPTFMWKKMPYLMLAKCAEALALRKAFPQDLSGIYTDDEMQQADVQKEPIDNFLPPIESPVSPETAPPAQETPKKVQLNTIATLAKRLGVEWKTKSDLDKTILKLTEIDIKNANTEELNEAIIRLEILVKGE